MLSSSLQLVIFGGTSSASGSSLTGALTLSASSQAENTAIGTTIGTLSVVGGSGSYTFTKTADPDSVFTLTVAALKNAVSFSYETATFHLVTIQADNGAGDVISRQFTILVTDVNEAPVITSNGGGATAAISVSENTTAVTTVTATDVDAATTLTYSISGGADANKFTIGSSTGVLTFVTAPNFEIPTDANLDNAYVVIVRASDGILSDTQTITVTVTNVNEAPVITSNGGGSTASISVAENTTSVTTVTATDVDSGATLTYSITGGADAIRFTLGASSGILSFLSAPNFEVPTDANADNAYVVIVQVSDGTFTASQTITVTVTDVSEGGGDSFLLRESGFVLLRENGFKYVREIPPLPSYLLREDGTYLLRESGDRMLRETSTSLLVDDSDAQLFAAVGDALLAE